MRKKTVPQFRWNIYVPLDVAAEVEVRLKDPARDRATYGSRSALVEQLLRRWIREQKERT